MSCKRAHLVWVEVESSWDEAELGKTYFLVLGPFGKWLSVMWAGIMWTADQDDWVLIYQAPSLNEGYAWRRAKSKKSSMEAVLIRKLKAASWHSPHLATLMFLPIRKCYEDNFQLEFKVNWVDLLLLPTIYKMLWK